MTDDILFILLRTTLVLTLCGGICFLALRKIDTQLPHLSRLLWIAVLLTGWFWLQPVVQIETAEFALSGQDVYNRRGYTPLFLACHLTLKMPLHA